MIDAKHLETTGGLRVRSIARGVDRGRERNRLTQFAPAELAVLEGFDQISDEALHAVLLPLIETAQADAEG